MNTIITIFHFEWKKAWPTRAFRLSLLGLLAVSLYAIFNGSSLIRDQRRNIDRALASEDSVFRSVVAQIHTTDTASADGKIALRRLASATSTITSPYKRWTSYWEPGSFAFLSAGNRDVYPYYHELEPYSFYMRFFKNEVSSPLRQLYGNFDLAFVIVLLFPLWIIALTFDAWSSEKESGTLAIVSLARSAVTLVTGKFLFNWVIVSVVLNGILVVALIVADHPRIIDWLRIVGSCNAYLASWFLLCYVVCRLRKTSVVNAIALTACWILLTIALPAIFNTVATTKYPVTAEIFSNYIRRVQMPDDPAVKAAKLREFFRYYPQYADTDTSMPAIANKLYVVYGNLSDRSADPLLERYIHEMRLREAFLAWGNFFNPVIMCQRELNAVVGTDLESYIAYVKSARAYVQVLKESLTAKVFADAWMTDDELLHRLSFVEFLHQTRTK
ncbi:DUF3526 domain-containing protein [Hufsiella ginkgonis]|uniref:DUF3526 domain-containing protein n=1 Tax=Hufsiella ginkgonis TaxID=2695274 RepID=A0A7K1XS18_9SPHI|nr:DUF3526 domain-containing protein [Hufsiella ginkgonis]MXV13740.1 DUF3526 domain-containing protein [Hufsiella ginkgonis]